VRGYHGCRVPGCRAAHYSKGYCRRHLNASERGRIFTGENLREFRRKQNWNQEKLSSLLSISKSHLQSLETSRGPLSDEISAAFTASSDYALTVRLSRIRANRGAASRISVIQ